MSDYYDMERKIRSLSNDLLVRMWIGLTERADPTEKNYRLQVAVVIAELNHRKIQSEAKCLDELASIGFFDTMNVW